LQNSRSCPESRHLTLLLEDLLESGKASPEIATDGLRRNQP
jgi:hypothetical protein